VGLGDLTASTWFPTFVRRMKEAYPTVTIQPEIDLSMLLHRNVEQGRLDFAILPEPPKTEGLARVPIGEAPFGWFAPPGSFSAGTRYPLRELGEYTVIEQSSHSIITSLCAKLWEGVGVQPERIYGGNNVVALAGLIAAGIGVSCLPVALFRREIDAGKLVLVETDPAAPSVVYYCTFLRYPHSALGYAMADIARACCDFSA
jgi:DNA-binding transcriptional LysR family regulator